MYDELVKRLRAQAEAERFFTGEEMLYLQAADAIEELSKPRWIPVTERLPEKWVWVLVCFDGADVPSTGFINGTGNWIGEDMYTNYGVTHWMPVPEPPKEE